MKAMTRNSPLILLGATIVALGLAAPAAAEVKVQCPDWNSGSTTQGPGLGQDSNGDEFKCMHISGSDGFAKMADDTRLYIFSFSDLTESTYIKQGNNYSIKDTELVEAGLLAANVPAPTVVLDEGQKFFLTLTNVGMLIRPDLFDPHTVHYHGFPDASAIFDGVPDATVSINQEASITYFYNITEPGTYMYHCHVEATEHMQMGMLGNLYVRPAQNRLPDGTVLGTHVHSNPPCQGDPNNCDEPNKYVYNDQDGSTLYDVEFPIQIGSFDGDFHDASETVQPLPFAAMKDNYPLLNGRGYPDTIIPNGQSIDNGDGKFTQKVSSLIEANAGQKILLRISNLNVTNFYTLALLGLKMKVVGQGSRLRRGYGETDPANHTLYYETTSVTLGGGEAADVIIDTAGVTPGTYVLYTTNLNFLSNNQEDLGGMMTEIVIN